MYGSFRGQSPLPALVEAELNVKGEVLGRIPVATAATPLHDRVLLVQAKRLKKYDRDSVVLIFDGVSYAFDRHDPLTDNVILAPVPKQVPAPEVHHIFNFPSGNGLNG